MIAGMDESSREQAESFAAGLMAYLESENLGVDYLAGAYLKMCADVMSEQKKFMQTGEYSCESFSKARENVYENEEAMKSYMHGLLLSQFLWKNHNMIFNFYLREVSAAVDIKSYLEIGPGHGLFLSQAVRIFPEASFLAVDISRTSLGMAKKMVETFSGRNDVAFEYGDIRNYPVQGKFDFIGMCEVLEHVEDPKSLLTVAKELLAPGGRLFVTTCANCPAVDHLYNFNTVEAIGEMIADAGLKIVNELALAVEEIPREKWTEERAGVNYAATLEAAR